LALPYCPAEDFQTIYNELEQKVQEDEKLLILLPFITEFKSCFMVEDFRNFTKLCSFWSVYSRIFEDLPTSTNSLEAWHRSLNSKSAIANPNIYKCIDLLKKEENKTRIYVDNLKYGRKVVRKGNFYLKNVVKNYKKYKKIEYLEVLAEILKFKFD
jgi:hypothetical protein